MDGSSDDNSFNLNELYCLNTAPDGGAGKGKKRNRSAKKLDHELEVYGQVMYKYAIPDDEDIVFFDSAAENDMNHDVLIEEMLDIALPE